MKNSTFLAAVLLVVASCSSPRVEQKPNKKDLTISVQVDTTITCQEPITANRYSCSGQRLKDPKLIGIKSVEDSLILRKDTVISGDSLLKWGYVYNPGYPSEKRKYPVKTQSASASDFSWLWNFLKWILAVALIFVVVALIVWLLRELILALKRKASQDFLRPLRPVTATSDRSSDFSTHQTGGKESTNRGGGNQSRPGSSSGEDYDQNLAGGIFNINHVEHVHVYVNRQRR